MQALLMGLLTVLQFPSSPPMACGQSSPLHGLTDAGCAQRRTIVPVLMAQNGTGLWLKFIFFWLLSNLLRTIRVSAFG